MKFIKLLTIFVFLTACEEESNKTLIPKDITLAHLKNYNDAEYKLIQEDLKNIQALSFRNKKPSENPIYLATAGGPGSLKSTVLETILEEESDYNNFVYADPDPRALRLMINTYMTESLSFYTISQADSFQQAQIAAYNHWRGGSNYITNTIINKAFAKKYNIAHGATSTSPAVEKLYKSLKEKGYKIELVLCYAQDKTRLAAVDHRSRTQANYQSTPEDVINKGKMFPERFPTYFSNANKIRLYWADDIGSGAYEVARIEKGQITIMDADGYDKFVLKYTLDKERSDKDLPSWETLLRYNAACE